MISVSGHAHFFGGPADGVDLPMGYDQPPKHYYFATGRATAGQGFAAEVMENGKAHYERRPDWAWSAGQWQASYDHVPE